MLITGFGSKSTVMKFRCVKISKLDINCITSWKIEESCGTFFHKIDARLCLRVSAKLFSRLLLRRGRNSPLRGLQEEHNNCLTRV